MIDPYVLPNTPGDPDAGKPFRSIAGIAWRIGLSEDWTYRAWRNMCRMDGMPEPILTASARGNKGRRPLRWDARAFEIWLAGTQPPEVRGALGLPPGRPANENNKQNAADTPRNLEKLMV
jgi:hypothetical protein